MKIQILHIVLFIFIIGCENNETNTDKNELNLKGEILDKETTIELKKDKYETLLTAFFEEIENDGFYTDTNYVKKIGFYEELINEQPVLIYGEYGYHTSKTNNRLYKYGNIGRIMDFDMFSFFEKIDTINVFYFRKELKKGQSMVVDFVLEEFFISDTLLKNELFNEIAKISDNDGKRKYYMKCPFFSFIYENRIYIIYSRGTYCVNDIDEISKIFEKLI